MSMPKDEWINNRAYALWEQGGREHGHHHEHWVQANQEWEERERVSLPGQVYEPGAHQQPVEHAISDDGIPPEDLQYDSQEPPVPRLGKAPSDKKKSKTGSTILGKSQQSKTRVTDGKAF